MATAPEEHEVPATPAERLRAAMSAPIETRHRPVTLLAISAGLAALAPVPFSVVAVALMVAVAADFGRRR